MVNDDGEWSTVALLNGFVLDIISPFYSVFQKHPLLFSSITLRKHNQVARKFQII